MKTLSLLIALFSALSLNAQADESSPAIATMPARSQPLLQLRQGGGMPAPGGLASTQIIVTTRGEVLVQQYWFPRDFGSRQPGEKKSFELPPISAQTLEKIKMTVASLKGGPLVEPTEPGCMDAPSTDYSIFKGTEKIAVYGISQCRQLELQDESQRPAAGKIVKLLNELLKSTSRR